MHHFVSSAPWDWQPLLAVARDYALEQVERHAPVATWIVDDTGMPKKGSHSVGVARQYCGRLGTQDNCQVVVTVSMANSIMSVPCAYRLYLPEVWTRDRKRCREAGIPDEIPFATKWEIALSAIDGLLAEDLPRAPVTADAGYGSVTAFDTINHKVIAKAVTDIEIRSGATATAGGLVFTALQDGWVVAYNDETLEELWRFNVGTALKGAPVTYAIGSKQYLAVQAGGRHLHPVKFDNLQDSSYLFVFALN